MKRKMPPKAKAKPQVNPPKKIKTKSSAQAEILQSSPAIMESILSCCSLEEVLKMQHVSARFNKACRSREFWTRYQVFAEMRSTPENFYSNLYRNCFGASWSNFTLSDETLLSDMFKKKNKDIKFDGLKKLDVEWPFSEEDEPKKNDQVMTNLVDLLCKTPSIREFGFRVIGESITNLSTNTMLGDIEKKAVEGAFNFTKISIVIGGVLEGDKRSVISQFVSKVLSSSASTLESLSIRSVDGIDAVKYFKVVNYTNLKHLDIKLLERNESSKEMNQALEDVIVNNAEHLETIQIENDDRVDMVALVKLLLELAAERKLTKLSKLVLGGSDLKETKDSFKVVSKAFPSLKTLSLKNLQCGSWMNKLLQSAVNGSELNTLALKGIEPSEEQGFLDGTLENVDLPLSLSHLSLKKSPVSDSCLRKVFSKTYPNMRSLSYGTDDISMYYLDAANLNEDTLKAVLPHCPKVESLWIGDSKIPTLFPILCDFAPQLLTLNYECPEMRAKLLVDKEAKTLKNLVSLNFILTCSNDELAAILKYTPNLGYLFAGSSNLTGQAVEVLSEAACCSKLVDVSLVDVFYETNPPCICDAELNEIKQQNFKLANPFKKLDTLELSIGHHLVSLKLIVAIVCYCPVLEELVINQSSVLEGIDHENLIHKELEELIASKTKKNAAEDVDEFHYIMQITIPRLTDQLRVRKISVNKIDELLEQSVMLVSGEISDRMEYQGIALVHHLLLQALGMDEDGEDGEEGGEDDEWVDED